MHTHSKIGALVIATFLLTVLVFSSSILTWGEDSQGKRSIGERFQHETSLTWRGVWGDLFSPKPEEPPQYKRYSGFKNIKLPKPNYRGMAIEETF